ncbi:MAG TPA: molybdopterin-dependent oxidoreductase, partial [Roseiflexaceae bacterium]|nr:molybdopterin-dependent oxidoreductase [Roseiflexaceae bacterium]
GKVEVCQHIRTSLAQAVADELRVTPDALAFVMSDTDRTPYDMGTVGSRTTPFMARRLRQAAATTRELLRDLAAARLGVPRDEIRIAGGWVIHPPSGHSFGYGELTQGQPLLHEFSEDAPITPATEWSIAGSGLLPLDGHAVVTGARRYTSDITLDGMLAGAVVRPPAPGASVATCDTTAAEAIDGVQVVIEGALIGVVAADRGIALRARDAIRVTWNMPHTLDSADLVQYLRENPAVIDPAQRGGPLDHQQGDYPAALASLPHIIRRSYTIAPIAHAPLEPRVALAAWHNNQLTVWTGTQRPFPVRAELAAACGIDETQVRVIVPPTGAAYGGKHTGEASIEAALLARAVGRPVKIIWTRAEEFRDAYVRPAGVIDVAIGSHADGRFVAYGQTTYNAGAAGILPPYTIPHQQISFQPVQPPMRQGSYRALAATANTFARESAIDELAQHLGIDPLQIRLANSDDPRLRAVLEAAAELFGWATRSTASGRGCGIAAGTEKGSYVATCAEVEIRDGTLRVVRLVQAFECGAIVNPIGLRSQVEGAIIQGLGGALFEAIELAGGRIATAGFSEYRVPRFPDLPAITISLLDRRDLPSAGGSETPIIAVAPAIANALAVASGERRRGLPLAR